MKELVQGAVKNVHQGWKTTVLGILVIGASIASVFVKGASWGDAVIGIGLGLGLLFAPDKIIKKNSEDGSGDAK